MGGLGTDRLMKLVSSQPADAPRHPEAAIELGRAAVEAAVDVQLLVHRGPVTVEAAGSGWRSPPPPCTAGSGRPVGPRRWRRTRSWRLGRGQRRGEVRHERRRRLESQTWLAPSERSSASCSGLRTTLTSSIAVGLADPDQHLAEVRRRGGMQQRGVALEPHRLDHAQRGQRVHETRGAVPGVGPIRQYAGIGPRPDTGTRCTSTRRARRPFCRPVPAPRGPDPATTTTPAASLPAASDWPNRALGGPNAPWAQIGGDDGLVDGSRSSHCRQVGAGEQQAEVRGVDRGRQDPDHHLVRLGRRNGASTRATRTWPAAPPDLVGPATALVGSLVGLSVAMGSPRLSLGRAAATADPRHPTCACTIPRVVGSRCDLVPPPD